MAEEVSRARGGLPPAPPLAEGAAQIPPAEAVPPDRATTVTIPRVEPRGSRWRRRFRWALGLLLLLAALGAGGWWTWANVVPHYTHVPKLVGLAQNQAVARLQALGLAADYGPPQYSPTVPAGAVLATTPRWGAKIRTNATVMLVISRGPQLITVPNVVGLSQGAATRKLEALGFRVRVKRDFNDNVHAGDVISQSSQDVKLEKGSQVVITVSRGPELVTIHDVSGQPVDQATGTLQSLGFQTTTTKEFSTTVPVGHVIGTDPPAGQSIPKGNSVTLVVSKGPKTFPMPNVVGEKAAQAKARLEALGLVVREVQVPGSINDTVVGQKPDPGTTVHQGEDVTIYVGG